MSVDTKTKPLLILLPGMDGTGELFAPFLRELDSDIEVLVVAYPCDEAWNYLQLEHHVRGYLPINRPYVLLGESFSGPIAIAIAASRPPQLIGLILCCTFARNPQALLAPFRACLRLLPKQFLPDWCIWKPMLAGYVTPELKRILLEATAKVSSRALQTRGIAALSVDYTDMVSSLTLPILYLRALDDWVVPKSATLHLLAQSPHIVVVDFHAPHFLLQVKARDAARVIERFFRSF